MANIDITGGITYQFARIQGNTVILGSDDHNHAVRTIGNQLVISGSNVPNQALDIFLSSDGNARIQRPSAGSNNPLFTLRNASADGYAYMLFDGSNKFAMGTFNDSSLAGYRGHFQLRDSTILTTSPETDSLVLFSFSPDKEFYLPTINNASATNYLRYDASSNEVTYLASTQKIKKNIISPPLKVYDSILALQPRYFEMKNPKDADRQFLSFIAEEAAAVSPQFATYGADYNYDDSGSRIDLASSNLVPMDIDERAIIAALVGKIQDLENRIKTLENN